MTEAAKAASARAEPFDVLHEITPAHVSVLETIERAFDEGGALPDLDGLRAQIALLVDRLRRRVAERTTVSPEALLLPLVCLYDERVMVRAMEPRGEEHWSRIQRADYAPREDGGDLFFTKEREILRRANSVTDGTDPAEREELTMLVTLYRFCLAEGFQGRSSESPAMLKERIAQLDAALASLVPRRAPTAGKPRPPPPSLLDRVRDALGLSR